MPNDTRLTPDERETIQWMIRSIDTTASHAQGRMQPVWMEQARVLRKLLSLVDGPSPLDEVPRFPSPVRMSEAL
jgi:hypothetical protein